KTHLAVSTGCDHDVLLSIGPIRHGCRDSAAGQFGVPKYLAAFNVKRAEPVVHRGPEEDKSSGCYHRSAAVRQAHDLPVILTNGRLPAHLSRSEIYRCERTPRGRVTWLAGW